MSAPPVQWPFIGRHVCDDSRIVFTATGPRDRMLAAFPDVEWGAEAEAETLMVTFPVSETMTEEEIMERITAALIP